MIYFVNHIVRMFMMNQSFPCIMRTTLWDWSKDWLKREKHESLTGYNKNVPRMFLPCRCWQWRSWFYFVFLFRFLVPTQITKYEMDTKINENSWNSTKSSRNVKNWFKKVPKQKKGFEKDLKIWTLSSLSDWRFQVVDFKSPFFHSFFLHFFILWEAILIIISLVNIVIT